MSLHGGRIACAFLQAEGVAGRCAPLAAAFAVATGALHRDRTVARLKGAGMAAGDPAQGLATNRAARRRGVRLGLGAVLEGLPEQFLDILGGLDFEMTEGLVAGQHQTLDRMFQSTGGPGGQHGQRFGGGSG